MFQRVPDPPAMGVSVAGARPITAADVRAPGATREPLRKVVPQAPGPWWHALAPVRLLSLVVGTWIARMTS